MGAKRRDRRWQLIGDDHRHADACEHDERQHGLRSRDENRGEQQADRDRDDHGGQTAVNAGPGPRPAIHPRDHPGSAPVVQARSTRPRYATVLGPRARLQAAQRRRGGMSRLPVANGTYASATRSAMPAAARSGGTKLILSSSAPASAPVSMARTAVILRIALARAAGEARVGGETGERHRQDGCRQVRYGKPSHRGVAHAHGQREHRDDHVTGEPGRFDVGCRGHDRGAEESPISIPSVRATCWA
jgi:hypothetical protein